MFICMPTVFEVTIGGKKKGCTVTAKVVCCMSYFVLKEGTQSVPCGYKEEVADTSLELF